MTSTTTPLRAHAVEAGGCAPPVWVDDAPGPVNFVCLNTSGRYSWDYNIILRNMVLRNCTLMERPCAWWVLTDRPEECPEGFNPILADPALPGWWAKLQLFSPKMPWVEGDRVVYFDLDVAITGRIEDLVETKGIIKDWHWPGILNTSVMVWDHGEHRQVWERFTPQIMTRSPGPLVPAEMLPKGQLNSGDQEWISEVAEPGEWQTFPAEWFPSYRTCHAWPSEGSKAVIMHGRPKNHEITTGWVPNVWRVGGYTSLPAMTGVNTTEDERLANVRVNVQRDLPWFTGFKDEGKTVAIVCGAPSMRAKIGAIRKKARHGVNIVSVNNAWRFLMENGVTPDVHVMLDARPQNAEFVKGLPKTTRLLLASQCHPDVFDAALAEGLDVIVWHNAFDSAQEALREILDPWWSGPNQRPCILVPGGCTVGLRSLWLAAFSGFRTIHVYGMDSSYADDGSHHAYAQPLNDGETVIPVARGEKTYRCALWMVRQAAEFQETRRNLLHYRDPDGRPSPVAIHVHGKGLIPDIAREVAPEAKAA